MLFGNCKWLQILKLQEKGIKNKKNIVNTGNTTGSSIIIILDVAYLKIIPFVKWKVVSPLGCKKELGFSWKLLWTKMVFVLLTKRPWNELNQTKLVRFVFRCKTTTIPPVFAF